MRTISTKGNNNTETAKLNKQAVQDGLQFLKKYSCPPTQREPAFFCQNIKTMLNHHLNTKPSVKPVQMMLRVLQIKPQSWPVDLNHALEFEMDHDDFYTLTTQGNYRRGGQKMANLVYLTLTLSSVLNHHAELRRGIEEVAKKKPMGNIEAAGFVAKYLENAFGPTNKLIRTVVEEFDNALQTETSLLELVQLLQKKYKNFETSHLLLSTFVQSYVILVHEAAHLTAEAAWLRCVKEKLSAPGSTLNLVQVGHIFFKWVVQYAACKSLASRPNNPPQLQALLTGLGTNAVDCTELENQMTDITHLANELKVTPNDFTVTQFTQAPTKLYLDLYDSILQNMPERLPGVEKPVEIPQVRFQEEPQIIPVAPTAAAPVEIEAPTPTAVPLVQQEQDIYEAAGQAIAEVPGGVRASQLASSAQNATTSGAPRWGAYLSSFLPSRVASWLPAVIPSPPVSAESFARLERETEALVAELKALSQKTRDISNKVPRERDLLNSKMTELVEQIIEHNKPKDTGFLTLLGSTSTPNDAARQQYLALHKVYKDIDSLDVAKSILLRREFDIKYQQYVNMANQFKKTHKSLLPYADEYSKNVVKHAKTVKETVLMFELRLIRGLNQALADNIVRMVKESVLDNRNKAREPSKSIDEIKELLKTMKFFMAKAEIELGKVKHQANRYLDICHDLKIDAPGDRDQVRAVTLIAKGEEALQLVETLIETKEAQQAGQQKQDVLNDATALIKVYETRKQQFDQISELIADMETLKQEFERSRNETRHRVIARQMAANYKKWYDTETGLNRRMLTTLYEIRDLISKVYQGEKLDNKMNIIKEDVTKMGEYSNRISALAGSVMDAVSSTSSEDTTSPEESKEVAERNLNENVGIYKELSGAKKVHDWYDDILERYNTILVSNDAMKRDALRELSTKIEDIQEEVKRASQVYHRAFKQYKSLNPTLDEVEARFQGKYDLLNWTEYENSMNHILVETQKLFNGLLLTQRVQSALSAQEQNEAVERVRQTVTQHLGKIGGCTRDMRKLIPKIQGASQLVDVETEIDNFNQLYRECGVDMDLDPALILPSDIEEMIQNLNAEVVKFENLKKSIKDLLLEKDNQENNLLHQLQDRIASNLQNGTPTFGAQFEIDELYENSTQVVRDLTRWNLSKYAILESSLKELHDLYNRIKGVKNTVDSAGEDVSELSINNLPDRSSGSSTEEQQQPMSEGSSAVFSEQQQQNAAVTHNRIEELVAPRTSNVVTALKLGSGGLNVKQCVAAQGGDGARETVYFPTMFTAAEADECEALQDKLSKASEISGKTNDYISTYHVGFTYLSAIKFIGKRGTTFVYGALRPLLEGITVSLQGETVNNRYSLFDMISNSLFLNSEDNFDTLIQALILNSYLFEPRKSTKRTKLLTLNIIFEDKLLKRAADILQRNLVLVELKFQHNEYWVNEMVLLNEQYSDKGPYYVLKTVKSGKSLYAAMVPLVPGKFRGGRN